MATVSSSKFPSWPVGIPGPWPGQGSQEGGLASCMMWRAEKPEYGFRVKIGPEAWGIPKCLFQRHSPDERSKFPLRDVQRGPHKAWDLEPGGMPWAMVSDRITAIPFRPTYIHKTGRLVTSLFRHPRMETLPNIIEQKLDKIYVDWHKLLLSQGESLYRNSLFS